METETIPLIVCNECDGTGELEKNIFRGEEGMQIEMDVMITCPECGGTGSIEDNSSQQTENQCQKTKR